MEMNELSREALALVKEFEAQYDRELNFEIEDELLSARDLRELARY
jgi:hypothetical protein